MSNPATSQLGVLGTGGMGGALYAASSSLASIDNEIMNMELKLQASGAKTSAEITKIRLNTQVNAASQTEEATKTQASEEFATAGASLFGCVAGIGFGIKDFSGKSLDDEIADTKSFRDAISPKAVEESKEKQLKFETEKKKIEDECDAKIKVERDKCSSTAEEQEINDMEARLEIQRRTDVAELEESAENKILGLPHPLGSIERIEKIDEINSKRDQDITACNAKNAAEITTQSAAIRQRFTQLNTDCDTFEAEQKAEAATKIQTLRTTTFGNLDVVLQAGRTAPTPEEQVIDRWVGNDLRAPKVGGFKGHDEEEAALNKRAAELLKADPNKLRSVRNTLEEKLAELLRQKDSINANKQQSYTMTANSGSQAVSQGVGGYYKTEGAKDSYASSIDNATAQSIEMAEKAFQDGVRNYEQAAEQLRQAAIQIAQGYQQAARG